MKVSILLVTFTLFITTNFAQNTPACAHQDTYTRSIAPQYDTVKIESLSTIYNNFEVEWAESLDGNVEATISVCSDDADEFNSLLLSLDNEDGAVKLTLDKAAPTTTSTTAQGTTSGPPKGVYTSGSSITKPNAIAMLIVVLSSCLLFPKNRFGILLSLFLIVLVLNMPSASASTSSSSTTIKIKLAAPTSINAFCVSGQCVYRNSNGPVTEYVSLFGKRFAALDQLYGGVCDKNTIMQVPTGWTLAAPTTEALLAIYLYDWKTSGVITSDGTSYKNLANGIQVAQSALNTQTDYFGAGVNGYGVSSCDSRILITQDFPVPELAHQIVGTPTISNFITFNGYDYATDDNTAYSTTVSGCQTFNLYTDASTEWQIAPEEDASILVIQSDTISWGTDCLIMASGNSYMHDTTKCSGSNAFSTISYGSGTIYVVTVCNTHASRIMVRRPSKLANTWATEVPITKTFAFDGGVYATLDSADPLDLTLGSCQAHFMSVPTGWRLANAGELARLISAQKWAIWGSTYCFGADGIALDHNNASCSGTVLKLNVGGVNYYQTSTCGRILIVQSVAKATDFTIGMKILLLSVGSDSITDVALQLALTMFNATGADFDWIHLLDSNLQRIYTGDLPLLDNLNQPKYYAIILTDGQLTYTDPATQLGASALTESQQTQLTLYKYQYSVRLVALTSYPKPSLGVDVVKVGFAEDLFAILDPSFAAANPSAVGGIVSTTAYNITSAYYIEIAYTSSNVVPFLRYVNNATEVPTTASPVGGAVITLADGTEEMHFFIGNSATFTHGPVLSSLWLNWVTKGLWLGNRRVYLVPQIDDLFLETEQFDNPEIANRMTGDDLRKTRTALDTLMPRPAGSTITCEFGINGAGVVKQANTNTFSDELYDTVRAMINDFTWESHTYTHLDFTCPESNCALYGTTTYEACSLDLSQNIDFFNNFLFADTGKLDSPTFSRYCMITPAITGLFNANALKAILDNGIACVVGDNSIKALIPENVYHGLITTAAVHGVDGVFVVPRFATEIYFDVSTPASEVIEYNSRYGIGGTIIPATQNATLHDILVMEGAKTARNLCLFRHDAYMFHQANLVHFNFTVPGDIEREWSLYTLWMYYVLTDYTELLNLPILNVKHDDLWAIYKARMASDACGTHGAISVKGGVASGVTLTSTGSCSASVTGLNSCDGVTKTCSVDQYGPDSTVWVNLDADTVTLAANLHWTS